MPTTLRRAIGDNNDCVLPPARVDGKFNETDTFDMLLKQRAQSELMQNCIGLATLKLLSRTRRSDIPSVVNQLQESLNRHHVAPIIKVEQDFGAKTCFQPAGQDLAVFNITLIDPRGQRYTAQFLHCEAVETASKESVEPHRDQSDAHKDSLKEIIKRLRR